jgi:pilus assembly protein Flp/PilA
MSHSKRLRNDPQPFPTAQGRESGQGMVEYALILALVALIVIVALIATGGQLINLFSNITQTMCLYKVGC